MQTLRRLIFCVLCIPAITAFQAAQADELSVVGVVLKEDGARAGGVLVELYVAAGPDGNKGLLTHDTTSDTGVFHLNRRNVSGITEVFVVIPPNALGLAAKPIKAPLRREIDGFNLAKIPDFQLLSPPKSAAGIPLHVQAVFETASVRERAGVITRDQLLGQLSGYRLRIAREHQMCLPNGDPDPQKFEDFRALIDLGWNPAIPKLGEVFKLEVNPHGGGRGGAVTAGNEGKNPP